MELRVGVGEWWVQTYIIILGGAPRNYSSVHSVYSVVNVALGLHAEFSPKSGSEMPGQRFIPTPEGACCA